MRHRPLVLVPDPARADASPPRWGGIARFVAWELAVWSALYGAYLAVRGVTIGSADEAFRHAGDVVALERRLGIFHEGDVQQAVAPLHGPLSAYYMLGFGPVVVAVAIWLAFRDRPAYRRLRTALLASIAFATVVFVLFPTAPPRLVGGLAIEDTVGLSSHDAGSFFGIRFNPYAAMPSMHVGWSLLVAVYGFDAARRRVLRALFAVHPALMALTVTATGNHYILDSAAGAAIASATLVALRVRARRVRPPLRAVPTAPESAADRDDPLERRAA